MGTPHGCRHCTFLSATAASATAVARIAWLFRPRILAKNRGAVRRVVTRIRYNEGNSTSTSAARSSWDVITMSFAANSRARASASTIAGSVGFGDHSPPDSMNREAPARAPESALRWSSCRTLYIYPTSIPSAASARITNRARATNTSTCPLSCLVCFSMFFPPAAANAAAPDLPDHLRVEFLRLHLLGGEHRDLVPVQRTHDLRRDHHHQLGLVVLIPHVPEQRSQDRDVPQKRDLVDLLRDLVVDEPGQHEGLAVRQLQPGFRPSGFQRWDPESLECDRVGIVELAHFLGDSQVDLPGRRDLRLETETDAVILVHDGIGGGSPGGGVDDDGKLPPYHELPLRTVGDHQVRLGEDLESALVLEDTDEGREVRKCPGFCDEEIHCVAEGGVRPYQTLAFSPQGPEEGGEGVRGAPGPPEGVSLEQVAESQFFRLTAVDLGHPDLEEDLLQFLHLEEIHDAFGIRLRGFRQPGQRDVVPDRTREDKLFPRGGHLDGLPGSDLREVFPDEVQVDPHDHLDRGGDLLLAPVDQGGRPGTLPYQQHLPRRNHQDVGRFRAGDGDPPDVEGAVDQDRLVGVQGERLRLGRRLNIQ